jgi:ABC-2 type transport system ATP-binding protein
MPDEPWAVVADQLRKRFGTTTALDGFNLLVPRGGVCGLLGPNGAGKTTAVRILTTLLRFDSGRAEVDGFDVMRQAQQVRTRIGLVGQQAAVDEILNGRQNLELFGRLYHLDGRVARRRADDLLEQFGLAAAGKTPVKHYSGGMRRRLDVAASFILAPSVLFLDEPTTGLDPRGRNEVWEAIRRLVRGGTTVLLTTQYLDEADQLANQISVIDHGRVIADGTPEQLKSAIGSDRLEVVVRNQSDLATAARLVERVADGAIEVDHDARRIEAHVADRVAALMAVVRALDAEDVTVEDIALRRPTLDDVFLRLTGHRAAQPSEEVAA